MKITEQCVVALTWSLKDTLGEELDTLDEPIEFLVGGTDLLKKIEEALQGHEPGEKIDLQIEPQDAFGDYDDRLLFLEPRHLFPKELEEGMGFEGLPEGCNAAAPKDRLFFVSDIYPDHVVMDANHPLAGIALRIQLHVHSVREADVSEIGLGSLGTGFFNMQINPDGDPLPGEQAPERPTLH
ncbi:peptidylprolyl isomerase [Hydrogenophaga crassostreae]|uniref:Peptidyl-prolyl cis-trans isomerase n=1 Tax=Hydrogenophaga crassostreae TaxID=1763535 RepID=A0A167J2T7_9BURK|nr:FKBP-type peptidyl-prolyl cis-trans isomerase [Hydrogenophaga crassostreae]AOW13841.1 peptidylprolyl isomerase [Hydrogenophaga crassostreae]OAD44348.1 peptidylprolyl isomerase [Hydrogenophaga crassostreae]